MNKQQEALKLALEALEETLRTLDDENAKPGGAISDTIWYSEHETLFDYIAAQITAIREALAEQPAQCKPWQTLTDEQPVSEADELPNGFVPLQKENGKLVYAACMDSSASHYKWLMWRHPDGQWVSKRKLEDWEVMQVEDQEHYGIVQEAKLREKNT